MTIGKKFKKKVRERMEATGESYSTARLKLLDEAGKECHNCGAPLTRPNRQNAAMRFCDSCVSSSEAKKKKLDGTPDGSLLCPEPDEAATNYMNAAGEHLSCYEAQCAANGNGGFSGEDGFPLCCACGYERTEHKPSKEGSS